MKHRLQRVLEYLRLPRQARAERRRDAAGLPEHDAGSERILPELIEWICRAQDNSLSRDGGVARDYSLLHGWATSYPETSGYIIPTLFEYARLKGDERFRDRALRMADWLVRQQYAEGGFPGGKVDSVPRRPVVFNTGQILLGLAAAQAETGAYLQPMRRAAAWLVSVQDSDGCWRRYESPFAAAGERQYDTHVAWGLFEADRQSPGLGYGAAGLQNVRWAVAQSANNGWLPKCCLSDTTQPLTHTLGYALRGMLEAYRFEPDPALLAASERTALGLLRAMQPNGYLPGSLTADWLPGTDSACLTGTAQVAICWLLLYRHTGQARYLDAARRANAYVRRSVRLDGPLETRGAVKGSFPVDGAYLRYAYPNWAAKFLADSLMLQARCEAAPGQAPSAAP